MPRSAAQPKPATDTRSANRLSTDDLADHIAMLVHAANQFMSRPRGEALIRSWLARVNRADLSENELLTHSADAVLLTQDLLLSQPSASGMTAFDRLAKTLNDAPAPVKTAIRALCRARFRLVRLEGQIDLPKVMTRDVLTGASLRIVGPDCQVATGTHLFCRPVMLAEDLYVLAGAVTPLDDAAFDVARHHPAAGATAATAAARWAEAVYAHVVRHGTLNIAGLNRPGDDFDPDGDFDDDDLAFADGPVMELAEDWMALTDGVPDEALLQRIRALADPMSIVEALAGAYLMRNAGRADLADALEQVVQVQLQTVQRREQTGSGMATLDGVAHALEYAVARGLPEAARGLFAALRQRLGNGIQRPDDPAMERLLARIRALRAKTVAKGCTEQEALAAAEKAAELLDRHGLSLGELDFAAQPCEGTGIQTTRRRIAPFDNCVPGIAAFFDCRVWVEQMSGAAMRYIFFGQRGDVVATEYLYDMVERAFETETRAFRAGEIYRGMTGERRSASHSFQIGLAQGICDKLHTLRRSRDTHLRTASGRDLVPMKAAMVDDELAKLGLNLRPRVMGGSKTVLTDAFEAGEAAGRRFDFVPAVGNAA